VNTGRRQPFATFLCGFNLNNNTASGSSINNEPIDVFADEDKRWRLKNMLSGNIAGEHYFIE